MGFIYGAYRAGMLHMEGVVDGGVEVIPRSCPLAAEAFKVRACVRVCVDGRRRGMRGIHYIYPPKKNTTFVHSMKQPTTRTDQNKQTNNQSNQNTQNNPTQRAAEGGYWSAGARLGLDLYKRGELAAAVAVLCMAAEEGYEVAQANAAYLLQHRMGYRCVVRLLCVCVYMCVCFS